MVASVQTDLHDISSGDILQQLPPENVDSNLSLLQALSVLSKLASLETSKYEASVRRRSPKHDGNSRFDVDIDDASSAILTADQVALDQSLKATPIVDLAQSIHRLHSNIALLQKEADHHAEEVQQLQQLVVTLQKQNHELEKNAKEMNKKNQKLTAKLKHKVKEKKCLVDHVKTFLRKGQDSEQTQNELDELRIAYKLQAHETFLMQSNRSRTASADSNISDGLDFLNHNAPTADDLASDESEASVYSLVTDDGVATLKLESPTANTVSSYGSQTTTDSFRGLQQIPQLFSTSPRPYTLTFPRGAKVGILIKSLELLDEVSNHSSHSVPKPNSILTNALLGSDEEKEHSSSDKLPANEQQQHNPFALPFNLNPFKGNHHQYQNQDSRKRHNKQHHAEEHSTTPKQHAFIVAGFGDFDESLNTKPALGARIIAVNHVAIPETCTLEDLLESLHASSLTDLLEDDEKPTTTYSVTFRNEPLTNKQREILQIASETSSSTACSSSTATASAMSSSAAAVTDGTTAALVDKLSSVAEEPPKQPPPPQQQQQHNNLGFNLRFMKMGGRNASSSEAETTDHEAADKKNNGEQDTKNTSTRGTSTLQRSGSSGKNVFAFWNNNNNNNNNSQGGGKSADKVAPADPVVEVVDADGGDTR